ncbi:metal-dependent transcriptional regulator [Methanobacterium alkalithermotolerans]|uniref:Metal-dependent transcriptional regulator n=1 Tax=Methanobacterium alkalithermotolerans TaxID=2731220 RepID=A0A8T8K626_9EURY|nr:metal-dependent transcriptional regulator [Methanobacterium alkalithermotolerans]QUH24058.1 metal-dependent transcriptional regulator [Methanobacterium alkalithermotolerans]
MSDNESLSENIEEYLEVIYKVSLEDKKPVTTSNISKNLNIAPGSVTQMLKKLDKRGYVQYSPYKGAVLTEKGLKVASKITRKHRLLERFLNDILKLKKDKIHSEACQMEHTLSDDAERALCQLLEQPDQCPDEAPIPACDFKFNTCEECLERKHEDIEEVGARDENLISVTSLGENEVGRVSFIRGDYKVIRRLMDMGITIGAMVSVIKLAPFKGPVEVSVRGSKLALGRDIAKNVFVELIDDERKNEDGAMAHG